MSPLATRLREMADECDSCEMPVVRRLMLIRRRLQKRMQFSEQSAATAGLYNRRHEAIGAARAYRTALRMIEEVF